MNAPLDHSRLPEPWIEPEPETKGWSWMLYIPLAFAVFAIGAACWVFA